jgi:hypothetical protein
MNIKNIMFVISNIVVINTQTADNKILIPLSQQANHIAHNHVINNEVHQCHADNFPFETVEYLEKWIYKKIGELKASTWDYHDILIRFRPQLHCYLAFLVMHWDDIENRDMVVFDTPAFKWSEIKKYYGKNYEEYTYHFNTICESIALYYDKIDSHK